MAYGWCRGHKVIRNSGDWLWADTHESIAEDRPCARCGRPRTPEGHDACLGEIPGALAACCGHGAEPGYILWPEEGGRGIRREEFESSEDMPTG